MTTIMDSLLDANSLKYLKQNSIVAGTISEIRPNEVAVNIGAKTEGIIPANEFPNFDELSVGEQVEVFVERVENIEGRPVLSYDKAQQQKNWENILEKCEEGEEVSGRVKGKIKGGLIVSIGVDAFLPASQIDVQAPKNLDQYLGQTFDLKIVKINKERRNIVVSRRELIESQRQKKRQQILKEIEVGSIRKGIVKNITDYGTFIDLDGLDGLLHITDMTWGRISHPNEMLKVGEEIEVMITDIDRDKERVSLGIKQMHSNPWDQIERRYPVSSKVRGKVVNLVPYGAFVELEEGVEGLIHITEFSWTKRISKPSEVLRVGNEVEAVILDVQKNEQKISLGIRQLSENPWDMALHNYPVGAHVRGKVRNLTTYGAFVELEEGIDGMVHISDMTWTRKINHPGEMLKKGDEIDAIVLEVDPSQQRISLGIKQLSEDPWSNIETLYKIGDIVTGKVAKVTSYGAFIELQNDIDGLVHISQMSEEHIEKLKDIIKVGDTVEARVIKIDKDERRLGLSIKAATYDESRLAEEIKLYDTIEANQDLTNLGDLLDQATQAKRSE
ncbi:MAG: 30S ribosomal protein S1 [Puniceicoccales bacterium]|jgi:small subunit ribosomal protein S1|nr:30S ribosomal protein S1 [Puniceicoccales bacterium]